jgi:hypothetical protein
LFGSWGVLGADAAPSAGAAVSPCGLTDSLGLVDSDVDIVTLQFDFVDSSRTCGRHGNMLACADIELRSMSSTRDLVAIEYAAHQLATIVCADVVEGIKLPTGVKQCNQLLVNFNKYFARIVDL